MTVLDTADDAVDRVTRHKSIAALLGVVLFFAGIGAYKLHGLNGTHEGFAMAGDLEEIKKQMVTKEELEDTLEPISASLQFLTCSSVESQLGIARGNLATYELKGDKTLNEKRVMKQIENQVHDLELRRNKACQ